MDAFPAGFRRLACPEGLEPTRRQNPAKHSALLPLKGVLGFGKFCRFFPGFFPGDLLQGTTGRARGDNTRLAELHQQILDPGIAKAYLSGTDIRYDGVKRADGEDQPGVGAPEALEVRRQDRGHSRLSNARAGVRTGRAFMFRHLGAGAARTSRRNR